MSVSLVQLVSLGCLSPMVLSGWSPQVESNQFHSFGSFLVPLLLLCPSGMHRNLSALLRPLIRHRKFCWRLHPPTIFSLEPCCLPSDVVLLEKSI